MSTDQISLLNKKLDRVLFYLEDDPMTESKGLVSTVKEQGKRIDEIERGNLVKSARIAGASATIGGILGAVMHKALNMIF